MLLEMEDLSRKVKEVMIKKELKVKKSSSVGTNKKSFQKKQSSQVITDNLSGIESG